MDSAALTVTDDTLLDYCVVPRFPDQAWGAHARGKRAKEQSRLRARLREQRVFCRPVKDVRSSSYHSAIFRDSEFHVTVERVAKNLMALWDQTPFDALVIRGISGAAIAYPVSFLTGLRVVQVRKEREGHHGSPIEGYGAIYDYVILDDFISTGRTIYELKIAMNPARCVAVALWQRGDSASRLRRVHISPAFVTRDYTSTCHEQPVYGV